MLHRFRERFGTAGLVVSVVALVFALAGGAFAASGGLNAKQKKQVKAIAKSFQGTGPAGTNGTNGTNGAKGDTGAAGSNGTNGTNGLSVTNTAIPVGNAKCGEKGGAEFKVGTGTATFACNGETGFVETLPSGESEYGAWSFGTTPAAFGIGISSISFVIPLAEAPAVVFVKAAGEEEESCPGSVSAPAAAAGNLCVYLKEGNTGTYGGAEVFAGGASLVFFGESLFGLGTWAVTAE